MKHFLSEFKAFAFKGNMIELAVAVIVGGAFGKVIDSLVKSVLMPLISYLVPSEGGDYKTWTVGRIEIGSFLGEFINFLLVAFAVFLVVVKLTQALVKTKGSEPQK
ncbi:MAG: large conductance mechanosensitive channel protein MscL [Proteobacteria bacterium]|nr:large conductance mechanosensitive channel protein MscL [Pseudomonadota bacterium]